MSDQFADYLTTYGGPERRDTETRTEVVQRVARGFRDVITLTQAQACRLFDLPPDQCERVLNELAQLGVTARHQDSVWTRAVDATSTP
jgi:hypothetical protein